VPLVHVDRGLHESNVHKIQTPGCDVGPAYLCLECLGSSVLCLQFCYIHVEAWEVFRGEELQVDGFNHIHDTHNVTILSVTVNGIWIRGWNYRPLIHSRLGTTSNYSATANLHNSQITTTPAKPISSLLCLHQPIPCNGF
jgi:hypothetical protein